MLTTSGTTTPGPVSRGPVSRGRPRAAAILRKARFEAARYTALLTVSVVVLLPISFAVLGGAKRNGQMLGDPLALVPDPWVLSNYTDTLFGANANAFWQQFSNSIAVAVVAVSLTLGLASMAAFVLARTAFRGREAVYTFFILGLLFPSAVAILPLYILVRELGLGGSLLGVALPQAAFGLPLTIIILRPFFKSVPVELEDAARIDGCGTFGFFWRILLPLARPALATVGVLALVGTWNAFLLPLVILGSASSWTLPLGIVNTAGGDAPHTLAYTVIATIPSVVFYFFAERQLVSGLTAGSLKE
jgi:raffinose/stachyose/melibiose transport system permease protein